MPLRLVIWTTLETSLCYFNPYLSKFSIFCFIAVFVDLKIKRVVSYYLHIILTYVYSPTISAFFLTFPLYNKSPDGFLGSGFEKSFFVRYIYYLEREYGSHTA